MSEKIGELGEYHPGRARDHGRRRRGQRDLGVQAVYDLARTDPRQMQRNANIQQRERTAPGRGLVQTGGIAPPPGPTHRLAPDPGEWTPNGSGRGQWHSDE